MAIEREVKATGKEDGNITKLCNSSKYWEEVLKDQAIKQIKNDQYEYYVDRHGKKTYVHIFEKEGEKHLRTDWDETEKNNLLELPDC